MYVNLVNKCPYYSYMYIGRNQWSEAHREINKQMEAMWNEKMDEQRRESRANRVEKEKADENRVDFIDLL